MGKKYAIFPTINMLHALGDMAQASGVVFIISTGFGAEVLGFYAFGLRVLRAPMGIIGNSISQVFYQKMIFVYNNKQSLKPMLRSILKKLFILALPPFLIIFTFSDYLFKVVFGDNWAEAGVYVQILCPWLYFNFVASSVSQIPMIVGKQREVFLISLMGNSIMLLMYVVGAYYGFNIKMVLAFVSLYMSIYTVLVILWTLKISDENF
jgi:O-antigen/teichoic acid export membrane protein